MNKIFKHWIVPLFFITVGAVIAAFALEEFLVPFKILDGGIVGVSMIVSQLSGLPLGILTIILNIPFVLMGFKRLGIRFLVKAIYAMVLFSVFLGVFKDMKAVTDKEILVVAFGGVLLGIGVGLILRYGGCLDGTEIVAMFLSKHVEFSVGQIVLFFNIIIYGVAGLLFGPDRALYSLLTYFITSKVIDIVENGMEQGKSVMIITDHGKDIADAIYTQLGRTCTQMEGKGMVSNGIKTVLYCVITRVEVPAIKKIINDADVSAFMTISDVSEIVGNHIKKRKITSSKASPMVSKPVSRQSPKVTPKK
ncbi:MAG: YitT family protein [Saccharofermentans sp.]|nr:YitT family protein [Saccharofermentans sp.]